MKLAVNHVFYFFQLGIHFLNGVKYQTVSNAIKNWLVLLMMPLFKMFRKNMHIYVKMYSKIIISVL